MPYQQIWQNTKYNQQMPSFLYIFGKKNGIFKQENVNLISVLELFKKKMIWTIRAYVSLSLWSVNFRKYLFNTTQNKTKPPGVKKAFLLS